MVFARTAGKNHMYYQGLSGRTTCTTFYLQRAQGLAKSTHSIGRPWKLQKVATTTCFTNSFYYFVWISCFLVLPVCFHILRPWTLALFSDVQTRCSGGGIFLYMPQRQSDSPPLISSEAVAGPCRRVAWYSGQFSFWCFGSVAYNNFCLSRWSWWFLRAFLFSNSPSWRHKIAVAELTVRR